MFNIETEGYGIDIYEELIVDKLDDLSIAFDDLSELSKTDWNDISYMQLTENFFRTYIDKLRLDIVIDRGYVSDKVLMEYHHMFDKTDWNMFLDREELSPEIIKAGWEKMELDKQIRYHKIPASIQWKMLKRNMIDFVELVEFQDMNTSLLEKIVKEDKHYIPWYDIATKKKLSKKFIRAFQEQLNFTAIAKHQDLSEDIMKEFKDKFDWKLLSEYQKLSKDFILEVADRIDIEGLLKNQKINKEELDKFGVIEFLKLSK